MKKNYYLKRNINVIKINATKLCLLACLVFLFTSSLFSQLAPTNLTFSYTGSMQTFTVPGCASSVTITAAGAKGIGTSSPYFWLPGNGGIAQGVMTVSPGQVLNIFVGGTNGYNGGGAGSTSNLSNGGGASDVRLGGISLTDRVIVAGGGGGAGGDSWQCSLGNGHGGGGTAVGNNFVGGAGGAGYTSGSGCGGNGGNAGGTGGSGTHGGGGGGGGFISGGIGATSTVPGTAGNGSLGIGGAAYVSTGCISYGTGGGGGGYYGGGGAAGNNCGAGRGGGGSSWTGTLTSPTFTGGINNGNGYVIVSYVSGSPEFTITPSNSPTLCSGSNLTLTAIGTGTIYNWSNGASTQSIVVSPSVVTTYSVVGTNTAACISSIIITVQNTSISVSSSTAGICVLGNSATLSGNGANTYTWSGGNTTNTIVVSPSVTTTYSLSGTNSCGTYSTTQTVAVLASTIVATSSSSAICLGNAATLTASGATTYTWMPGNIVGTNAIVSPTASTIFSVSGTNSIGCIYNSTTQATAIIVNPNPNVNSTSNVNYSVCPSTPVILNGIGANTYTWSSGVINGVAFPSQSSTSVYTVTGTNTLTGCTSIATAIIYVYSTSITISPSPSICSGSSATLSASGALNYTWTGNNTTLPFQSPVVSPLASVVYTVNAITSNYCPVSGTVAVTVNPSPVITAVSNKTSFCRGESSSISVSGASTYLWSNGATSPSITVSPTVTSFYTVNGVSNNCNSNTASVLLTVNFCTSIDRNGLIQNNISVYPNPNNGEFTIKSNEAITLDLINQLGQVVKVITLNETNNHQANISNVANGIYFIVGKGNNSSINQKVIVNK